MSEQDHTDKIAEFVRHIAEMTDMLAHSAMGNLTYKQAALFHTANDALQELHKQLSAS